MGGLGGAAGLEEGGGCPDGGGAPAATQETEYQAAETEGDGHDADRAGDAGTAEGEAFRGHPAGDYRVGGGHLSGDHHQGGRKDGEYSDGA